MSAQHLSQHFTELTLLGTPNYRYPCRMDMRLFIPRPFAVSAAAVQQYLYTDDHR
jgi:hypothetical protein